jgi:poly(3-hydroxybutyrate) depolymerase
MFRSLECGLAVVLVLGFVQSASAQATASADSAAPPTSSTRRIGIIHTKTYDFKEANAVVPYDLYVSRRYSDAEPAPLIIALHGNGASPTSIMLYQGLRQLAEARGYIVAAPMGFSLQGGYGNPPRNGGRRNQNDPENIDELSEQDVLNVLARIREEYNIDAKRIYLLGHSMGGGGTWHLGLKHPELWAALAPVAPSIARSPDALSTIRDMPVILVQGDQDPLVRTSRLWAAKMKELGMHYEYIETPGGDHMSVISRSPDNMRRIFDFFEQATRDRN